MGTFHQQYYTWSTNGISKNNKVGLGIVASSEQTDGPIQKIVEKLASSCHVCKQENITIEKMVYSRELGTFVILGATPCAIGADMRENKFVHAYTYMPTQEELVLEEYFAPFSYQKEWNDESKLAVAGFSDWNLSVFSIVEKYQLKEKLERFFQVVFRAVCANQKPCYIIAKKKKVEDFMGFAREMMYLVHKILPAELRKEADYVSFAREDIEQAHFIFKQETEKPFFFEVETGITGAKEDIFLEQQFYSSLSRLFLEDQLQYEETMEEMSEWFSTLGNTQNCLEKLIWFYFRDDIASGNLKVDTKTLLGKVDSFIYWAKKDPALLPVLETVLDALPPSILKGEDSLVYTRHLLLGEQGETHDLVYRKLSEMLGYFFVEDRVRFQEICSVIEQRNYMIYDTLVLEYGNKPGEYGEAILHTPIQTPQKLKEVLYNHQKLLSNSEYKSFLLQEAYRLYQDPVYEKNQKILRSLGEKIDKKAFQNLIKKDILQGVDDITDIDAFKDYIFSLQTDGLGKEICAELFDKNYKLFLKGDQDLRESMIFAEISEKIFHPQEAKRVLEQKYKHDLLGMEQMEEIKKYVIEHGRGENAVLRPIAFQHLLQVCGDLRGLSDFELEDAVKLITEISDDEEKNSIFLDEKRVRNIEQAIKDSSIEEILQFPLKEYKEKRVYEALLNRYNELARDQENIKILLKMKEEVWINFIIDVISPFDESDTQAKMVVQTTKDVLKQNRDLRKLYEVNRVLVTNGYSTILCPREVWNRVSLGEVNIAVKLWSITDNLSLDHIYELLRKKMGDRKAVTYLKEQLQGDVTGTKKLQIFLKQKGIDYNQHSSNIVTEVLYDLLQTYYIGYLFTLFMYINLVFQKTGRMTESYLLCSGITIFLVSLYCYEKLASRRRTFQLSQIYFIGITVAMVSSIVFLLPGPKERTVFLIITGAVALLNFIGIWVSNRPSNTSQKKRK